MKKILVIGNKSFEPGFKLLASDNIIIEYIDDDKWKNLNLFQKLKKALDNNVVHYFWVKIRFFEMIFLLLIHKRIIQHFIGSDVLLTIYSKRKTLFQKLLLFLKVEFYANSEQLIKELQAVKIYCKLLPFVNRNITDCNISYPENLKVISYIPDGKEEFYGLDELLYCANRLPEVEFLILKNTGAYHMSNVKTLSFVNWGEMLDLYNHYSVFVRMTKHDSLSNSVLEALACARHVIWTYTFPHCFLANSKEELYSLLKEKDLYIHPNSIGQKYVIDHYSNCILKDKYAKVWNQ